MSNEFASGNTSVEIMRALLNEMQFWNQRLNEHARLIRSGVDLTEDPIIREADAFVIMYDMLMMRLNDPSLQVSLGSVPELVQESKRLAADLGQFKTRVGEMIRDCRTKAILPAELLEHIRQELDYFKGKLNAVTGGPRPTWAELGLDQSNLRVEIVPRMLLEEISGHLLSQVAREELLFWLHISADHGLFLGSKFKPIEQAYFTQESLKFSTQFSRLQYQVMDVNDNHVKLSSLIMATMELNCNWINFLADINNLIATCQIPSRQTNFWPALGVHIMAEQVYFQSILQALLPRLSQTKY